MSKSLALDDFLGHETKSGGSSNFLRGWRKRKPPIVDVFLHRKSGIIALWQHNVPRIYEKKVDGGGKPQMRVFGGSWNCLESEDVLKKQYRRERDTGERTVPPVMCPVCRTMEFFREAYGAGVLDFAAPLFKFVGDDPAETQVITFGGMCNLYGSDKLTDSEKAAMAKANVKLKEAWKENIYAKCNYLFVVADADNPADGVQIAVETTSLGDHVKECIRNQMTSLGEDDGNPILKPYALRWEHNAAATEFGKKYKCIAMPKVALTKEVELLINSDPPDLTNIIRPGNVTTLRASLEGHYIGPIDVDWDEIFGPAERAGFGAGNTDDETPVDDEGSDTPSKPVATNEDLAKAAAGAKAAMDNLSTTKQAPAPTAPAAAEPAPTAAKGRSRKKADPPPPPPPSAETIACDECGHMMAIDASVCPQCGAEYELEPANAAEAQQPAPPAAAAKGTETKKGVNF